MFRGEWYNKGERRVECKKCGLQQTINIYGLSRPCPKCGNRWFIDLEEKS